MSAGSPALPPSRSWVVEAICIRLTDAITQPRLNAPGGYASRWKLVLSAYNQIRGRLHNSQLLSEQTDLALYSLNETTLTKWLLKCIYLRTTIEVALFSMYLLGLQHIMIGTKTKHAEKRSKPSFRESHCLHNILWQRVHFQPIEISRLLPLLSPGLQRRFQTRMTLWARPRLEEPLSQHSHHHVSHPSHSPSVIQQSGATEKRCTTSRPGKNLLAQKKHHVRSIAAECATRQWLVLGTPSFKANDIAQMRRARSPKKNGWPWGKQKPRPRKMRRDTNEC